MADEIPAAPQEPVAQGQDEIDRMRYAGASNDDVESYKSEVAQRMQAAGAGPEDVKSYFGIKEPDMAPVHEWVKGNLDRYNSVMDGGKPDTSVNLPTQHYAKSYFDSFVAGLGTSTSGLRLSYPTTVNPPDADRAMRILSGIGQFTGDIPEFVKGAEAGGIAGGAVGMAAGAGVGSIVPGVGTLAGAGAGAVLGAASGGMAGGMAATEGIRRLLMDKYEKGEVTTSADFSDRLMGATWAATKGGIVGAATGLAGPLGGKALGSLGAIGGDTAAAAMKGIGGLGTEISTMTTVGAALEGQLPDWDHFTDAAIMVAGAHGLVHVVPKLANIYRNTGKLPAEVVQAAGTDPVFKEELLSSNPHLPEDAKPRGEPGSHLVNPDIDKEVAAAKEGPLPADVPHADIVLKDNVDGESLHWDAEKKGWVHPDGNVIAPEDLKDPEVQDRFSHLVDETKPLEEAKPPGGGEPPEPPVDEPGSEANKKIDDMIVERPDNKRPGLTIDRMTQQLTDDLNPVKSLEKDVTDGDLTADKSPYTIMRNFRNWAGKVWSAYKWRTLDFNTLKENGEGLDAIMKDVPDKDVKGLTRYMVSERVLNHEARGIEHGFDVDAAKEVVARDQEKFGEISKRLTDFQNRIVKYAVDSGILSAKNAKRFMEMNKKFIPLHRLLDIDPLTGKVQGDGALYKATDGSVRKVLNPLETVYKVTAQVIKRSEMNRAMLALTDLKEAGEWMARVLDKRDMATDPQAMELLEAHGEDGEGSHDITALFRDDKGTLRDNEKVVWRDGKREVWAFKPELAEAIAAMDYHPGQAQMWFRTFAKPLFMVAGALRAGTVLVPGFLTRHFERSQIISAIQSKYPHVPLAGVYDALGHIWKQDETWKQYVESGAPNSAVEQIHQLMEAKPWELDKQTGWLSATRNRLNPKQVMQLMAHLSDLSDNAARVDAYKRAGGVDGTLEQKTQGAMDARQITLDYTRIGAQVRVLSGIIPFMNVGIQGTARTIQAFRDDPVRMTAMSTACITMPTLVNFAINHNDSRYKNAPETDKRLNWIIPTDKWEPAVNMADAMSRADDMKYIGPDGRWMVNNGTVYKIPRPFELGVLFGAIPEAILDHYINKNPHAYDKLAETVLHGLIPNVLPTGITPVLEQMQGTSFFTKNKLVPNQMEQYLPQEQYTDYTSETAKQLAKFIGTTPILKQTLGEFGPGTRTLANPMIVDNYIRDWSGTMGSYAVQVMDHALHAAGVGNLTPQPAATLNDVPYIKEFMVRNPSAKAQSIQDFYTKYEDNVRLYKTIQLEASRHDFEAMQILQNSDPGWQDRLTGIAKGLSQGNKFIQQVYDDPKMSRTDKRQLINTTYYQMMKMADDGNRAMEKFEDMAKKK